MITDFNGTPAKSVASFRNTWFPTSEIGKEFALTYLHEGQEKVAKVTLVPYEDEVFQVRQNRREPGEEPKPEVAKSEVKDFGLDVQDPDPGDSPSSSGYATDVKGSARSATSRKAARPRPMAWKPA